LVARRIARPVQQLAEGAAAISRGELNQRIEPSTPDEIGRLAAAFNHMAAQLLQQRTALEEAHAGLRRQFEELADLKSYTDNILGSLTSGIVTIDLGGRVVTLNPAAELHTGFFRGEAIGRYCTERFAHEIKNPLTSLLTFSRHLDRKVDDPNFRERFSNVVPRELERINGIVERLLELARPSRMSFTLVRLPEVLEGALELYVEQLD